jgi:hypothetical protein
MLFADQQVKSFEKGVSESCDETVASLTATRCVFGRSFFFPVAQGTLTRTSSDACWTTCSS